MYRVGYLFYIYSPNLLYIKSINNTLNKIKSII